MHRLGDERGFPSIVPYEPVPAVLGDDPPAGQDATGTQVGFQQKKKGRDTRLEMQAKSRERQKKRGRYTIYIQNCFRHVSC